MAIQGGCWVCETGVEREQVIKTVASLKYKWSRMRLPRERDHSKKVWSTKNSNI